MHAVTIGVKLVDYSQLVEPIMHGKVHSVHLGFLNPAHEQIDGVVLVLIIEDPTVSVAEVEREIHPRQIVRQVEGVMSLADLRIERPDPKDRVRHSCVNNR